jgi:proline iminopeptidase
MLIVYAHPGAGEPVLLLHGGPGCPAYLEPVAALLPGRWVVRFDQRGAGGSVAVNRQIGIEDYLADIEAVRAHCQIERWHIFGHSWGGLLAEVYARAHPDRVLSLFLSNSALGVGDDYRRNQREIGRHNLRLLGARGAARLAAWYAGTRLPGRAGHAAAKRMLAQVWRAYFVNPEPRPRPTRRGWTGSAPAREAADGIKRAPRSAALPVGVPFAERRAALLTISRPEPEPLLSCAIGI